MVCRLVDSRVAASSMLRLAGVSLSVLTVLAGCGGGAGGDAAPAPEPAVPVVVVRAASRPINRALRVTGSLVAGEEAEVAAETAGRVVDTPVERGTRVTEGAPLIRLSPTEAEASVQEAEANVAQIEVRLGVSGGQPFDAERVPEVSNARAARDLAAAEFDRIRKLYEEHVVSGSEFDQRRTQTEVTDRQYETARNTARQLFRQLEAARARLTLARKALADTVVRAPFAGLVVERKVSLGDFVTRGTKVVTVVRIDPLRLELTIAERDLAAVRPGLALDLAVDAYPGRTFPGEVRFISPALRAEQRALTVEAIVPNRDGLLKPGLFATASVRAPSETRALMVPSAAVRDLDGSMRVYVIKGDLVEERLVTVGQVVGDATEIVNGLAEGDAVAGSNLERLADGSRVRPGSPGVEPAAGKLAPAR